MSCLFCILNAASEAASPYNRVESLSLLSYKWQGNEGGGQAALTFDLEVRQLLQQRAFGHQLLVDGVLKAHGAGVGARHRQLRLHGRVDEQGVRCETAGGARGRQRDRHIPAEPRCELQTTRGEEEARQ